MRKTLEFLIKSDENIVHWWKFTLGFLLYEEIAQVGGHSYTLSFLQFCLRYTGWGNQSWTKLVFSMYKCSSLIEDYGSPEKGWLVYLALLAVHLFNVGAILSTMASRQQDESQVLWMYSAASQSRSWAMDGHRVARLAWTLACRTR
jgi:hypothetical protein